MCAVLFVLIYFFAFYVWYFLQSHLCIHMYLQFSSCASCQTKGGREGGREGGRPSTHLTPQGSRYAILTAVDTYSGTKGIPAAHCTRPTHTSNKKHGHTASLLGFSVHSYTTHTSSPSLPPLSRPPSHSRSRHYSPCFGTLGQQHQKGRVLQLIKCVHKN